MCRQASPPGMAPTHSAHNLLLLSLPTLTSPPRPQLWWELTPSNLAQVSPCPAAHPLYPKACCSPCWLQSPAHSSPFSQSVLHLPPLVPSVPSSSCFLLLAHPLHIFPFSLPSSSIPSPLSLPPLYLHPWCLKSALQARRDPTQYLPTAAHSSLSETLPKCLLT